MEHHRCYEEDAMILSWYSEQAVMSPAVSVIQATLVGVTGSKDFQFYAESSQE